MSAAIDARGLKRVCSECGGRFYDLNKRPIMCPSCDVEFTGEIKTKGRRGRVVEEEKPVKKDVKEVANDKSPEVEGDEKTVSLEDVKEEGSDDSEEADLANVEDEDLGDLGKDLGDLGAGVELDEDEDDIKADIDDVKKSGGGSDGV